MNDSLAVELRAVARQKRLWIWLGGIGFLIGVTGPFDTFETVPLVPRLAYWIGVVVTSFWIGYLTSLTTAIWLENRQIDAPVSTVISAIAVSVPTTIWVTAIHAALFDAPFRAELLRPAPYVFVITAVVEMLSETLSAREMTPAPRDAPLQKPEWLDRLPGQLGRDLILLQAQDHYVRALTDQGEALIRARLQDAADQLGPYGLRVHRSWWVARHAIRLLRYRKGAPFVVLTSGQEVPVGRTYQRAVRQALAQGGQAK